jgi:hypothetical protein
VQVMNAELREAWTPYLPDEPGCLTLTTASLRYLKGRGDHSDQVRQSHFTQARAQTTTAFEANIQQPRERYDTAFDWQI